MYTCAGLGTLQRERYHLWLTSKHANYNYYITEAISEYNLNSRCCTALGRRPVTFPYDVVSQFLLVYKMYMYLKHGGPPCLNLDYATMKEEEFEALTRLNAYESDEHPVWILIQGNPCCTIINVMG